MHKCTAQYISIGVCDIKRCVLYKCHSGNVRGLASAGTGSTAHSKHMTKLSKDTHDNAITGDNNMYTIQHSAYDNTLRFRGIVNHIPIGGTLTLALRCVD